MFEKEVEVEKKIPAGEILSQHSEISPYSIGAKKSYEKGRPLSKSCWIKGIVPWNKNQYGIVKQTEESIQKRKESRKETLRLHPEIEEKKGETVSKTYQIKRLEDYHNHPEKAFKRMFRKLPGRNSKIKKELLHKNCEFCGLEIVTKSRDRKFCNHSCAVKVTKFGRNKPEVENRRVKSYKETMKLHPEIIINRRLKIIKILSEKYPSGRFESLRKMKKSSYEDRLEKIINKNSLPYKYTGNGMFFIGKKCPDFISTDGEKIAIEVYHDFFKIKGFGSEENYVKSREKTFNTYGWKGLYLNDSDLKKSDDFIISKLNQKGVD